MSKKTKTSSFKGRVSANAKKTTRSGGGGGHLSLPKGVTQLMLDDSVKKINLDFIPYVVSDKKHPDEIALGELWYRRPYKLHRNIGADKKSYICLSSIGKRCPICEAQKEMFDVDKKAAIALYAKPRILYIVIPKGSKKHEEMPYIWDMAESLFHDTLKEALEEDENLEVFPDLEEGLTLKCALRWKSIGDGKPFPEVNHIDFEERDAYDESILDDAPNLDEIIVNSVLSYESLKAAFLEIDEEEEGGALKDADDDDVPKRSKSPISKKPSRKVEEDEDEEEDDDEPVKKPISKTSKSKLSSKKEDDDEEDEEGDDEEEKPVKKPISKTSKSKPVVDEEDEEDEDAEPEIPKKDRCVACQGTGKNSRGKICPICNGTGRKPEPEEDEDEDEKPTKTSKKKEPQATPNMKTTPPSKGKCPFGHKFGVDTEKFDDCDDCAAWSSCADAKEKTGKK